jgi:hypothetical protein
VFNETTKVIEIHDARVKRARDKFVAKLDEKAAAKYDAIVTTINTRFERDVMPLLEATFAETDPVKRKALGARAKEDGMTPLFRAMRAEAAVLGPEAPFPIQMLDYPNHKLWGQWMMEFGTPVSPETMAAGRAELERRRLAQPSAQP